MPDYRQTESSKRDYKRLSDELKESAKEAFRLFRENPNHRSLRIHQLGGYKKIWAGQITQKYVFTFHKERDEKGGLIYWFRRIGDHTIYQNP